MLDGLDGWRIDEEGWMDGCGMDNPWAASNGSKFVSGGVIEKLQNINVSFNPYVTTAITLNNPWIQLSFQSAKNLHLTCDGLILAELSENEVIMTSIFS